MTSLYNISSNIRELYLNVPLIWKSPSHTCKLSQCLCYLNSWSPTLPFIFSSYSGAPPKIRTFLDLPNPHFLFKSFEFNSNEFEFTSFNHASFHFLGTSIFLRVRENNPFAQNSISTFLSSPFLP